MLARAFISLTKSWVAKSLMTQRTDAWWRFMYHIPNIRLWSLPLLQTTKSSQPGRSNPEISTVQRLVLILWPCIVAIAINSLMTNTTFTRSSPNICRNTRTSTPPRPRQRNTPIECHQWSTRKTRHCSLLSPKDDYPEKSNYPNSSLWLKPKMQLQSIYFSFFNGL